MLTNKMLYFYNIFCSLSKTKIYFFMVSRPTKAALRKEFANDLSAMFGTEVPEYPQFTDIVVGSNEHFLATNLHAQVDSEDRVLAEKHGAIRVGTPEEMNTVTRIFAVFGMYPVEFYDMTQLPKGALPMIATAFRPIDSSIETSAFRMFCSMLHPDYITPDIKEPVTAELAKRREDNPKFSKRLMELLTVAETKGLDEDQGKEFISEVVDSFRINKQKPINFDLYKTLREKNDVFADIVCLGININHLTPRAYDIRDAQKRLEEAGIPMKDGGIEGPPIRDDAPNVQLNQTARKAPGEALFVSNDPETLKLSEANPAALEELKKNAPLIALGKDEIVTDYLARIQEELKVHKLVVIQHKARFGEIESRNTALTVKGEEVYKGLLKEKKYQTDFPKTHEEMFAQGLTYYTFELTDKGKQSSRSDFSATDRGLQKLLDGGFIKLVPQTYNDFLAASAAGIFKANMSTGVQGIGDNVQTKSSDNKRLLEKALDRPIISRHDIHKAIQAKSAKEVYKELGIAMPSRLNAECDMAINKDPVAIETGRRKAA